jgi:hypothetical protein
MGTAMCHWTFCDAESKSYPCNRRGDPQSCEASRLPHHLQIGSQMAVRLSFLCAGLPLHPGRFLVLNSVTGRVEPRAIIRLEGLAQFKNAMISSGIETATFRLSAQCHNQLRYCVPRRRKLTEYISTYFRHSYGNRKLKNIYTQTFLSVRLATHGMTYPRSQGRWTSHQQKVIEMQNWQTMQRRTLKAFSVELSAELFHELATHTAYCHKKLLQL